VTSIVVAAITLMLMLTGLAGFIGEGLGDTRA
jgi:hypothetical protein